MDGKGHFMRIAALLFCFLLFSVNAVAADEELAAVGFFKAINGEVQIQRDGARNTVIAGDQIFPNDLITTGEKSSAAIIFQDGTRMTLGADSEIEIQRYTFRPRSEKYDFSLYLKKGSLIYSSGRLGKLAPEKVNLRTPRATVGIRGTRLLLSVK